jgi:putative ABC transport system permease protein
MPAAPSAFARSWRQFTNACGLAFQSIRAQKLRSFLTLLGIIIGVASVILVGSAIEGLGAYAEQSTAKAFGSESFLVAQIALVGRLTRTEYFNKIKHNKRIRDDDWRFVEALNGGNMLYSPYRQTTAEIKRDNLISENASILGVAADMVQIRDIGVADGRFFTEEEERSRSYVAVIGDDTKNTLFGPESSPLGQIVRIQGLEFTVIGVQERLGSAFGMSQDNSAYVPVTVYERMFGPGNNLALFGRAKPGTGLTLDSAIDETRLALRARFHTRPGQPDNFDTLTPDAIRGFIDQVLGIIAAVIVPVTCISLVVGGIVIMNIMLVSVTERTREIGVRKSLGARHSDIMLQILIEAVTLSVLGGGMGLALGAAVAALLARIFEIALPVTVGYVALALVVSSVVGIASGWYPASRAARLDPVVALRAE